MIQDPIIINTLRLLAVSVGKAEQCEAPDMSLWKEIKEELKMQTVLPIVSDYAVQSDISPEEKLELKRAVAVNIRNYQAVMSAQKALTELIDSSGIPASVMKGAAAAQYYPKPFLRQFGDIDMLVLPEDIERAGKLLTDSGYSIIEADLSKDKRHIPFKSPGGTEVELHRSFSSSDDAAQNALLDGWLYEKLEAPVKAEVGGFTVPVFPTVENGLILLSHINQHLGSGLGMRQIIDWMQFVQSEMNDEFWDTQFKDRAEAIGMKDLAVTVTEMCRMYLGLSADITWCADADKELCDSLMLFIFRKGNFGRKEGSDAVGTHSALSHLTNPVKAFRYLTEGGMKHMAEAGIKPVKAFAWAYQIGHLARKGTELAEKNTLKDEMKRYSEDSELLKKLKVTRR